VVEVAVFAPMVHHPEIPESVVTRQPTEYLPFPVPARGFGNVLPTGAEMPVFPVFLHNRACVYFSRRTLRVLCGVTNNLQLPPLLQRRGYLSWPRLGWAGAASSRR